MDRLTWTCWGVMLSVFSVAVVAYRNDLSSTRHGCIWSTIENHVKESSSAIPPGIFNPTGQQGSIALNSNTAGGGVSLNCNLRTLSVDFWNYTFNREQIEQTRLVRIKCSDKLYFESLLSPNQTLFQTLRNLKEVQIESCKIRKLPKSVWASLTKLKTLVIRTQNIEWRSSSSVGLEVESGAFEGLGQLEVLDLSQNNIWNFKNSLCPLRSLLKLNVSNNRLSDIEELISSSNEDDENLSSSSAAAVSGTRENYCVLNVQNVDLSFNSLRRIGQDAFSFRMRRLTELRLQNNLLEELKDNAFGGLTQLRLLNISSNRIVALPPSIFKSNSNLRELYLNNNSISALSSQVFSKMDQLLLLDLSLNTLTSQWVKEDMFHGLIRLVVLKLSGNQLSYIDGTIFKDLISLQALYLNSNKIETVSPGAFQSLTNLHILDLSNNRLTIIDYQLFSNLFVLRQLYLDHNKIRKMDDDSLKNCTSLQDLGLGENLFQSVPIAIQGLGLLKTLDLGENKISSLNNESFHGMSQLYGLRLVDNKLENIPNGLCDSTPRLRVLNLSQNRIRKISSSALACHELRVLRLDANLLEEFPPTLAPQLPSLLWLNVSENRLKNQLDYHLLPPSIEWLDLSHNSLESLSLSGPLLTSSSDDSTLTTTTKRSSSSNPILFHLRVLDLSYNKLTRLNQSALPSSLETLRINHNDLKTVAPDTFIRSSKLRRVEMIGNQIENLPLSSLRIPPIPSGRTLPEFYLGDNPFLCDCSMEWLTRVNQLSILRQHPRIVDLDAIVCRTTFSRPNQVVPLVDTRPTDFLCPYKSHCFALCHCCDFDACDCEMTCPDNCTCYHDTAWSSNIVECSNLQYENIPDRIPMDSTKIYLDGNHIFELVPHIFIGKKNLRVLYLNNSHVEFIRNKTFNGVKSLEVLRLEDNLLSELQGFEFQDLESLRELYLHNNLLRFISPDTFVNLKYLQVLRLDGNLLIDFKVWELSNNFYLNSVTISGNPWSCDCEYLIPYRNWVATKTAIAVDFPMAKCQRLTDLHSWSTGYDDDHALAVVPNNAKEQQQLQPLISSMCNLAGSPDITYNYDPNANNNEIEINNHISAMGGAAEKVSNPQQQPPPSENHLNFSRLETDSNNTFWTLILCLTAFLIVLLVIVLVFRQEIYYWSSNALLHPGCGFFSLLCCCCPGKYPGRTHHPGKISCPSSRADELDKLFDFYFIYSKRDEDFVLQKIAPELEEFPPVQKFRLCLHYRDLCLSPESPWNREMILSACDASKRVVIVLSKTFVQSEWASSTHFRTSIQAAISLHQNKLLFILLPDFDENLSTITPELSSGFIKNSCLDWSDKNFWNTFRKHMPAVHAEANTMNIQIPENNCEQLPYNLIINPNLHLHHQQLHQQQQNNNHHYHQNIIPYQIPVPMTRNNSLPPIPKHQIVLPAPPTQLNWEQASNTNGLLLNPHQHHQHLQHHHHNTIISPNNHSIHPIPSQLAPQHFGYSNDVHLQKSNHHQNHHHSYNNHNQPIHFSSQQNPHQHVPISVIPPHNHSHTSSQISNSNFSYHHPHNQMDQNYSSSAVSSCANEDHVYSTLDSPLQSPVLSSNVVGFCPNGASSSDNDHNHENNCSRIANKHRTQHSTSSGISSGSDMTSGGDTSSSAVSPSSPIKNGVLNKLNECANSRNQNANNINNGSNNNGKMYFV